MQDYERTTETSVERFAEFIKFLVEEGHFDEAVAVCKSKGLDNLIVSVEHIRVIQEMLKTKLGTSASQRANAIIASGHYNKHC